MIYGFYWDDNLQQYDHFKNQRPWRASPLPPSSGHCFDSDCDCDCDSIDFERQPRRPECDGFPRGHIVSTAHVGSETAREAAEAFYKKAPAFIETLDYRALEAYFHRDNFGFGLQPKKYITKITIFLDRACAKEPMAEKLNPREKLNFIGLSNEALAVLFGNSRKKPTMTLLIKDEQAFYAIRTLEAALSLYGQLKALGVSVTIVFMHTVPRFLARPERVFAVNLGAILDLPQLLWGPHFVAACLKAFPHYKIVL
jgi:hypothetical protein